MRGKRSSKIPPIYPSFLLPTANQYYCTRLCLLRVQWHIDSWSIDNG